MEFAIPLAALGAAYVISAQSANTKHNNHNNNNNNQKQRSSNNNNYKPIIPESFGNMASSFMQPPLVTNYPTTNFEELKEASVNNYHNAGSATSVYFRQDQFENNVNNVNNGTEKRRNDYPNKGGVYSLTGEYVDKSNFMFGNMVPYYGSSVKGPTVDDNESAIRTEAIMDNYAGNGSQIIRKIEQAPLFKPEANMQWANGTPNASSFIQSRMYSGSKENNVKPFESEHVGPGLNQGYGSKGSDGFNSGMAAREDWMPKTVDQLRVDTNPKMEYSIEDLPGPSYSHVQNVGVQGIMEKNRPERAWVQNPDQWLTTTSETLGPRMRPAEMVNETARNETTTAYSGIPVAHDRRASYPPQRFLAPRRNSAEVTTPVLGPVSGANRTGNAMEDKNSYIAYGNNRTTTSQPQTFGSGFTQAIRAAVVPFVDMFNATKREEYIENMRVYGDPGSSVPEGYLYNENDAPEPTNRDMTMYAPGFNINNQHEYSQGGYTVADMTPTTNQRDTTNRSYVGDVGGACTAWGPTDYSMTYKTQTNNEVKEAVVTKNRPNQGNMDLFNSDINVCLVKDDTDRINNRMFVPQMMENAGASKELVGNGCTKMPQNYEEIGVSRIEPNLLDAFRSNPYTQSLQSY